MKIVLLSAFLILLSSSCSFKKLYPVAGATVGGGVGALVGGPGGAALGAFAGTASGEVLKSEEEVREAVAKVEALTTGDVEKMVELGLNEHKGWFQKTIDGIYDVLMLGALASVMYFIFQFWYGRHFVNKKLKTDNLK